MQSNIIKKTAVIFLIAAMICSLLTGCAEKKPQPEDTISRIQDAINKFDVDGIQRCIDSEWAGRIEVLLAFTPGEEGRSIGTFIKLVRKIMPMIPFLSDGAIDSNDMPQVAFSVLKTEMSGSNATVVLSGTLTFGEHTKTFSATVEMKLENDTWVVCGVSQ